MRKSLVGWYCIFQLVAVSVYGQSEISLYNLHRTVPQSHQLNPAYAPDAKLVIGLPILSSIYASGNLDQLNFNTVFAERSADDSLQLDFDGISAALNGKNNLNVQAEIQLFSLGLRLLGNYFSFALNEKTSNTLIYPKDLVDLAFYGNGDTRTFGRDLDMSSLYANQNYYHEFAFGVNRDIISGLRLGARVKFLYGVVNAGTSDINAIIRTDTDSIYVRNDAFDVRAAGYSRFENNRDFATALTETLPFKNQNSGIALDFGAVYKVTDNLEVSASLNDLGSITWKDSTQGFQFGATQYSFKGFDLLDVINNTDPQNNFVNNEVDSLEAIFTPTEVSNVQYKSKLQPDFYAGVHYELLNMHTFGLNFFGELAEGIINPAVGASYNLRLGRILNAGLTASLKNGRFNNFGAGTSVTWGSVQIYGATDNLNSFLNPREANRINARVGINLVFGRHKDDKVKRKKDKKEDIEEAEEEVIDEPEAEPVEEPPAEPEPEEIQEEAQPVPPTRQEPEPATDPEPDTVEEPPRRVEPEPEPEQVIEPEPEPVVADPVLRIARGNHPDEIPAGNFVIVGAFLSKTNAENYSQRLSAAGYDNQFGFLTNKGFYYVYVFNNSDDIQEARAVRNRFRQIDNFLFKDAWLLRVESQ